MLFKCYGEYMIDLWVYNHARRFKFPLDASDLPEFHTLGCGRAYLLLLDEMTTIRTIAEVEDMYERVVNRFLLEYNRHGPPPDCILITRLCHRIVNSLAQSARANIHRHFKFPDRFDYNPHNFRLVMPTLVFDDSTRVVRFLSKTIRPLLRDRFHNYQSTRGVAGWCLFKGILCRAIWYEPKLKSMRTLSMRFLPTTTPIRDGSHLTKIHKYICNFQKEYGPQWPPTHQRDEEHSSRK